MKTIGGLRRTPHNSGASGCRGMSIWSVSYNLLRIVRLSAAAA
jgi:hypothetical protein